MEDLREDGKEELATLLSTLEFKEQPVTFLRLAARLAAIGDRSYLDRALTQQIDNLDGDIQAQCKALYQDLQLPGEDCGLAVIAGQDLRCLAHFAKGCISAETQTYIAALVDSTEIDYDSDALEVIESFRDRFPIPSELLLICIEAPVGEVDMAMLDAVDAARAQCVNTQKCRQAIFPPMAEA